MNTEERLIDLEIRLARQDDLVETLNTQVYRQQKKLDEMAGWMTALTTRIRELADTSGGRNGAADERPPHY
ncbi:MULTISPECIES: SlyX family protein [unclassified Undibacterium]|uniref:SlyX family protein n=1 Tax=unclassified Undibacterium TaxID=2630295 RepID=UPI002AC928C6|nr:MULTISPECIES: SlyX family protein [unclassified Undibacterium]MEB0137804.1 SlyX family protein [Undibacterium sp. CCC2.1]MEB0171005.1 SlyX family protein [Undibacterium sp. CCC1.1]MEB0175050.1 SlyX family protein [Undibacterium sp. CCC3.4]MEB0215172.1 SlyX family protein [Undibacterium sp. 5I2]WPX44855.1 SlyX family protein [Undibacterium sp. CCC3.4]